MSLIVILPSPIDVALGDFSPSFIANLFIPNISGPPQPYAPGSGYVADLIYNDEDDATYIVPLTISGSAVSYYWHVGDLPIEGTYVGAVRVTSPSGECLTSPIGSVSWTVHVPTIQSLTPIFVVAGQSNSIGGSPLSASSTANQAKYTPPLDAVLLAQLAGTPATALSSLPTGPLSPRAHAFAFGRIAGDPDNFGPELGIGYALYDVGFDHAIVKFGVGSVSLATDWSPYNEANFTGETQSIYRRCVSYLRDQEAALGGYVSALVWVQGEADSDNATMAANYAANLTALAAELRKIWPGLLIIVVRLSASGAGTYQSEVRAAADTWLATDTNGAIINTDDLTFIDSGTHYNADSMITLGQRCGAAIIEGQLRADPGPAPAYTVDALSRRAKPYGAIEWGRFHAALGFTPLNSAPTLHHRFQDSSAPSTFTQQSNYLFDSLGGNSWLPQATVGTFQQPLPSWASKAIGMGASPTTTTGWGANAGQLYNPATQSVLQIVRLAIPSVAAAHALWQFTLSFSTGTPVAVKVGATGLLNIEANGTTTIGTVVHATGNILTIALLNNRTASTLTIYSSLEKLVVPYHALTDDSKTLGACRGLAPPTGVLYEDHVVYTGADAELTSAQIKAWLTLWDGVAPSWS